jgi:hypothetical protein
MIIEHIPGSIKDKTDTDKLPDVEAMILEKSEELRQLCYNAKRQCVILVDAKGCENGNTTQFWNVRMKDDLGVNDKDYLSKVYSNLFTMINIFVMAVSHGDLEIHRKEKIGE